MSAARTAKPSTLERSNGGASTARHYIVREHAAERGAERHGLGRERREIEMRVEARARLFGRHHFEELLLARGGAHARDQVGVGVRTALACLAHVASHGHGLTRTCAPAE